MGNTRFSGSIEIRPAVPQSILDDYPFNRMRGDGALCVITYDGSTYSEIVSSDGENTAYDDQLVAAVDEVIVALGDGYTYSDALNCYNLDDPSQMWRVVVDEQRHAVAQEPQVIYPGEAVVITDAGPLTRSLTGADIECALEQQLAAAGTRPHQIFRMIDLSTAHLDPVHRDDLSGVEGIIADRRKYGWLMTVPTDNLDEQIADHEVPDDIAAIWRLAVDLDCQYVLFDDDAEIDESLDVY